MKSLIYSLGFLFIISCQKDNNLNGQNATESIPTDFIGKKLYNLIDGRDWILINHDNTFVLHEYIPNSEETFEWRGNISGLALSSNQSLSYQGRNDYKATEINSQMEIRDSNVGKALCIKFERFSTISGSALIEARNYTPQNVSPY